MSESRKPSIAAIAEMEQTKETEVDGKRTADNEPKEKPATAQGKKHRKRDADSKIVPDPKAPLTSLEGQLARNPGMSVSEAEHAAKKEYNKINAARARKRTRDKVFDMQQQSYRLASDIANLKMERLKLQEKAKELREENARLQAAQKKASLQDLQASGLALSGLPNALPGHLPLQNGLLSQHSALHSMNPFADPRTPAATTGDVLAHHRNLLSIQAGLSNNLLNAPMDFSREKLLEGVTDPSILSALAGQGIMLPTPPTELPSQQQHHDLLLLAAARNPSHSAQEILAAQECLAGRLPLSSPQVHALLSLRNPPQQPNLELQAAQHLAGLVRQPTALAIAPQGQTNFPTSLQGLGGSPMAHSTLNTIQQQQPKPHQVANELNKQEVHRELSREMTTAIQDAQKKAGL